eukprot:5768296-Amphidinium_carterae.1
MVNKSQSQIASLKRPQATLGCSYQLGPTTVALTLSPRLSRGTRPYQGAWNAIEELSLLRLFSQDFQVFKRGGIATLPAVDRENDGTQLH